MFLIYFTNFGYYSVRRFESVANALAYAAVVGYEAEVRDEKTRKPVRFFKR